MTTRARFLALAALAPLTACSIDLGSDDERCSADNDGISLPVGFCAGIVADDLGHARHMTVSPSGDLFVALADGDDGTVGGVVALRDEDDDGEIDAREEFGDAGGNGIAWHDGFLYFAENDRVVRWSMPDGQLRPTSPSDHEVVISDLPMIGDHINKSIAFDRDGVMYLNIGSASNTCQEVNREPHSPGVDPCAELDVRAGVWRYEPDTGLRAFTAGERYAMGIRNAVALAVEPTTNQLVAVQNGRDQLFENWPELYTADDDMRLPSEELFVVSEGSDYGWPYCYHDGDLDAMVLAPEYGGDGTTIGRCEDVEEPDATFPAHWAPLSIHFYRGAQFPARYHGGAFVAFHGNRFEPAPGSELPGYSVEFQPFENGRPAGDYAGFADEFAGTEGPLPDAARHRPVGLAEAPDGSLYISDDKTGAIWRVYYGLE